MHVCMFVCMYVFDCKVGFLIYRSNHCSRQIPGSVWEERLHTKPEYQDLRARVDAFLSGTEVQLIHN
jgi:hypothetical protein